MSQNNGYNGFWKHAGCTLAALALLAFIGLMVMVLYFLFQGM